MADPTSGAVLAAVLAGGEGRRMGGDKPLRAFAGERLIDRAVRLARGHAPDVVVCLRSEGQAPDPVADVVLDAGGVEGPLAGLIAALKDARRRGFAFVLAMPCDAPFLPADLGERLMAGIGDGPAALAESGGRLHPACGLWRTDALDAAEAYAAEGRRSLRGLAERLGAKRVAWPAEAAGAFVNLNTPEELDAAERMT